MLIDGEKSNMETNQYKIRLKELNELYNIGKKVSLVSGSKRATTIKSAQAEKVVEKVLLHCNSIIKLFDVGQNEYSELDMALIASATRNIMDAANVYFYISERGISAEESNFRYNLQLLNYNKNIKDIYNKLNFPMDCFRMKLDDMSFVIEEIKNSSIYLAANNKEKSIILSGKQLSLIHILIAKLRVHKWLVSREAAFLKVLCPEELLVHSITEKFFADMLVIRHPL